jgi:hypothetical protein
MDSEEKECMFLSLLAEHQIELAFIHVSVHSQFVGNNEVIGIVAGGTSLRTKIGPGGCIIRSPG